MTEGQGYAAALHGEGSAASRYSGGSAGLMGYANMVGSVTVGSKWLSLENGPCIVMRLMEGGLVIFLYSYRMDGKLTGQTVEAFIRTHSEVPDGEAAAVEQLEPLIRKLNPGGLVLCNAGLSSADTPLCGRGL